MVSATDQASRQLTSAVFEMQRAVEELSNKIGSTSPSLGGPNSDAGVKDLALGVNQLVTQMRAEQKVVREWVDEQSAQQAEVSTALRELTDKFRKVK
jgi:formiminotetrahydrofolate cyclodeaminase